MQQSNYVNNPNYPSPSPHFNADYVNSLHLRTNSPNIDLYKEQQQNYMNINHNYSSDLNNSYLLLKYLNKSKRDPDKEHPNIIYNERQIDVNKYYIMKYQSESYILKLIIFFCGLALIGSLFFFKGFIGETLYIIYLGIIISIGIITIGYNIYNLLYRDNIRFDEYDYGYMSEIGTDIYGNTGSTGSTGSTGNTGSNEENKCI